MTEHDNVWYPTSEETQRNDNERAKAHMASTWLILKMGGKQDSADKVFITAADIFGEYEFLHVLEELERRIPAAQ
jgi:hypothetical protein